MLSSTGSACECGQRGPLTSSSSSALNLRGDREPPSIGSPRELMRRIFVKVIADDNYDFRWMAELACVCRRWDVICQDPLMCEFVAKRTFVAYPLVLHLEYAAPLDDSSAGVLESMRGTLKVRGHDEGDGGGVASSLPQHAVPHHYPLSRDTLRQMMELVQHYRARASSTTKYVQRRRSFVLHVFLSATLLSLALAITAAMCAAEDIPVPYFCRKEASFGFLWLCYLCIVAIIVSNVVMQAHFEPQHFFSACRRNRVLIIASAAVILLGVLDVMVPTALIQVNMSREQRFSWLWCGTTVILSFCAWQCYALACIMPDARAHLQNQLTSLNVREGLQFVMMNVPNAFPLLFAAALFCALQYVQRGSRFYVFLGGVPVVVSLGVLAMVFLLDYLALQRTKDLSIALSLFHRHVFPLSLLRWEFRGWCLGPLAASVMGFFLSHARYVVRKALHELRATEHGARIFSPGSGRRKPDPTRTAQRGASSRDISAGARPGAVQALTPGAQPHDPAALMGQCETDALLSNTR